QGPRPASRRSRSLKDIRRWTSAQSFQSLPSTSPPVGVTANHQVLALMLEEIMRTLASHRATTITLVCGVAPRSGSQLPLNGVGCTWKIDAGPAAVAPTVLSRCQKYVISMPGKIGKRVALG